MALISFVVIETTGERMDERRKSVGPEYHPRVGSNDGSDELTTAIRYETFMVWSLRVYWITRNWEIASRAQNRCRRPLNSVMGQALICAGFAIVILLEC